jgi:hypothetical protein
MNSGLLSCCRWQYLHATPDDLIQCCFCVCTHTVGVSKGPETETYWLSFNVGLLEINYGKGYHMVETTLLEYKWPKPELLTTDKEKKDRLALRTSLFGTKPKLVRHPVLAYILKHTY